MDTRELLDPAIRVNPRSPLPDVVTGGEVFGQRDDVPFEDRTLIRLINSVQVDVSDASQARARRLRLALSLSIVIFWAVEMVVGIFRHSSSW